jgi:RecJ-like exonuclease
MTLIKSENLEKLQPLFGEAVELIKKAISKKRQIIIKHHDDADGYISGFILEKALSAHVEDKRYMLQRSSSRTPYYEYIDSLRDLNSFIGFAPPLIILSDLGSNNQSMKAIKRLERYGADFIILDHHKYDEENKKIAKVFLNPHIFDMGSDLCAGMLATELALMLTPLIPNIQHLPALAGTADKSVGIDYENYLKISKIPLESLKDWALVVDHETYYLRFAARPNFLEDLFNPQKLSYLDELKMDIKSEMESLSRSVREYVRMKEYPKFKLLRLDRKGIGDYEFASSKLPKITHELVEGPRITLIETPDGISYRADIIGFKGVELIEILKTQFPKAMVSGGGHEAAGGIRFNASAKDEIMAFIEKYLEGL